MESTISCVALSHQHEHPVATMACHPATGVLPHLAQFQLGASWQRCWLMLKL